MYGGRQRGIYEIHFRIVKAEGEKDMTVEKFGETSQGKQANLYVFENKSGMMMSVSDYGATLVNVMVPDKTGKLTDVVLGFDDVTGYERGDQSFGATVGRNANRIGGASFTLNGSTYELEKMMEKTICIVGRMSIISDSGGRCVLQKNPLHWCWTVRLEIRDIRGI